MDRPASLDGPCASDALRQGVSLPVESDHGGLHRGLQRPRWARRHSRRDVPHRGFDPRRSRSAVRWVLEGPSIYAGSAIGDAVERRFPTLLREEHAKVLLIADAAAGIAAIFKAPLTGIMFAVEVPYQDDLARHALIPAIFSAATSYLVFVALIGTAPLFPVRSAALSYPDLLASVGVGGRLRPGGAGLRRAIPSSGGVGQSYTVRGSAIRRWLGAARSRAHLDQAVQHTARARARLRRVGRDLARGSFGWSARCAADPEDDRDIYDGGIERGGRAVLPIGVDGLNDRIVVRAVHAGAAFPVRRRRVAAFIGAVYNVLLAGVTFLAETTGAPGHIIPGLLAAAIAYLVSGRRSLSEHQRARG